MDRRPDGLTYAPADAPTGVRLAELVAALSLATDLGIGLPMDHVLRQTLIGLRLGDALGLDDADRAALYHVGLLAWVGCTADSFEFARLFGDDIAFRAESYAVDLAGLSMFSYIVRHLGAGRPPLRRARIAASLLTGGMRTIEDAMRSHCELAGAFAGRLGLGPRVQLPLTQVFERWDGKGAPAGLRGADVELPARIVQLADIVEVFHANGGVESAVGVARERSGKQFDPDLVGCFCAHAAEILDQPAPSAWDAVIDDEPGLQDELTSGELDTALETVADFVDLKTPYTAGHSRGVAELAAEAARRCGLPAPDVALVRRAGLVHDLGRTGVSNAIWDKPGPLSGAELERVRLHPYLTERMLSRPPALARIGAVAALHHERLDGSGYHRGVGGDAIGMPARILAAADVYHAMLEPRAHREARTAEEAVTQLRDEVRAGRLDANAVDAVLTAAGHRVRRRPAHPAGLTPREIEVLALLARGTSNRDIAGRLHISAKTVGNHVEHIYTKIGVSSRAAATLFATRHGLIDPLG
jgi:HD-GYP domain-containing protein (c-di-GMP phosphodiesterase class II)